VQDASGLGRRKLSTNQGKSNLSSKLKSGATTVLNECNSVDALVRIQESGHDLLAAGEDLDSPKRQPLGDLSDFEDLPGQNLGEDISKWNQEFNRVEKHVRKEIRKANIANVNGALHSNQGNMALR
jgi:hypothetical protein